MSPVSFVLVEEKLVILRTADSASCGTYQRHSRRDVPLMLWRQSPHGVSEARRNQVPWTPSAKGSCRLMVRATSGNGQVQRTSQWNRSGYQRDVIEHLEVVVA